MSISNVKKAPTKEEVHSVLEIAQLLNDILSNPCKAKESIIALHALSEEEQKKHEAARALIDQHREVLNSNTKILEEHKNNRIAFGIEQKKSQGATDAQAKELGELQEELQAKDQRLTAKDNLLAKKERELSDKSTSLAVTETALNARAEKLQILEKTLADKSANIAIRENDIQAKQDKLREVIG